MERIMNITTYKNHNFTPYNHQELGEMLSNKDVALGYGITQSTLRSNFNNNSDELIEGVHWLRVEVQTKGGKQKVIHWTLDGIHMLGFFIKSNEAKHFRKWASKLITEMRKGYTAEPIQNTNELQETILKQNALIASTSDTIEAERKKHKHLTKLYEKTLNENETLKQKMKQQLSLIVSQVGKEILTRFEESLEVTSRSLELQSLKQKGDSSGTTLINQ